MKAVVFIDVQKDFIDGVFKSVKAIDITPKIVEFAKQCVENGYKLYATRDTHEKSVGEVIELEPYIWKHVQKSGYLHSLEGRKLPFEHCIEGTDGWMIDDRLMEVIEGKATIVNKPTFGSFDLAEIIDEEFENDALDEIIICGFVTSVCVLANAVILRAKFPNTKITIMKDLCTGSTDDDHSIALKALEMQMIEIA